MNSRLKINRENLEQIKRLPDREAHLWFVSLLLPPAKFLRFDSILSPDEAERASRFRNVTPKRRYMAARGWLRTLLASYVSIQPEQLRFAYNDLGKPRLADESAAVGFSVSHSDDCALLGFVRKHNIGVDLERVHEDIEFDVLAKRFFLPNEFKKLQSLPADQRLHSFYCAWTRKEAYLKARGEGLFQGLHRIEVSLLPDEPAKILSAADDAHASRNWMMKHLSPRQGYVGAVAVDTTGIEFKYFRWEQEQYP